VITSFDGSTVPLGAETEIVVESLRTPDDGARCSDARGTSSRRSLAKALATGARSKRTATVRGLEVT